jgi:GNAT superfamily N-acetyltransferase
MLTIREMREDEVDAVTGVINAAFVVERFFKKGDRTTPDVVRALTGKGLFLVLEAPGGDLAGSVYVEIRGASLYVGMVAIDPPRQGTGLGRMLMAAAENHGREHGCSTADITVVNLRTELPPFYRRLGYVEVGTTPFDRGDEITQQCHFIAMSKPLRR